VRLVALGKEVTFTAVETSGLVEIDEMVCVSSFRLYCAVNPTPHFQFLYQAKIGMYTDTPVPNPALVALGVKFGTMEEFIKTEVVPRFA